MKTLIVPPLYGQDGVWQGSVLPVANRVDSMVSTGNLIGLRDWAQKGANARLMEQVALYSTYSTQWTQLIGANELLALQYPELVGNNIEVMRPIRRGWLDKGADWLVATTIGNRLITHGGLTHGEWLSIDKPETPQEAADRLNEKYGGFLNLGESYMTTGYPNHWANPVFADPMFELFPSWLGAPDVLPFDQIHTSGDMRDITARRLTSSYSPSPLRLLDFKDHRWGTETNVKGQTIISQNFGMDKRERYAKTRNMLSRTLLVIETK